MRQDKITVEELGEILAQQLEDQQVADRILAEVRNRIQEQAGQEEAAPPRPETRNITFLVGGREAVQMVNVDELSAFTVQVDSGADHNALLPHMIAAARTYNDGLTRRGVRIRRFGDIFDTLKPKKHLDQFPKRIYTKESALIIATENLPVVINAQAEE